MRASVSRQLVVAVSFIFLALAAAAADKEQWIIGQFAAISPAQAVPLDFRTRLISTVTDQQIVYGSRSNGINLVWGPPTPGVRPIKFVAQSGTTLSYDAPVAIYVRHSQSKGMYVRKQRRDDGIDLVWSSNPAYEWEIRRSGGSGGPVTTGDVVSLYNRVEKDYVVYCDRTHGINLGWLTDPMCNPPAQSSSVREMTVLFTESAPGIFTATVSPSGGGTVLGISNAGTDFLFLLGRNVADSECLNPTMLVSLAPNESASDAQRMRLFGAGRPPLPVALRACIGSVAGASTPDALVRVRYRSP